MSRTSTTDRRSTSARPAVRRSTALSTRSRSRTGCGTAAGGVFEVVGPEIEPETEEPEEPEPEEPKQTRSKIDKGKVYALWDAKWPAAKIADEMGCSGATIYKILKERDK